MLEFGIVNSINLGKGTIDVRFDQKNDKVLTISLLESAGYPNVGETVACVIEDRRGICLGKFWNEKNLPNDGTTVTTPEMVTKKKINNIIHWTG